jgi:hypothetical protein
VRATGSPSGRSQGSGILGGYVVALAFLGLAGLLALDPWPFRSPVAAPRPAPAWATDPSPVRLASLRPETVVGPYRYRCSECHSMIVSPIETDRPLTQHPQIRLDHGINRRCFNCHHRTARDSFADDRGEPIPYDQPQVLCSRCHGPVYRDWLHGVHGRTNGSWNSSGGPARKLRCIECHDPHSPAFGSLRPAPPPSTLRMGEPQGAGGHHGEIRNPLAIFGRERDAAAGALPAAGAPQERTR